MQVLRCLLLITFKCQQGLLNSFEFQVDICRSQGKHLEASQRFKLLRFHFNIMISNCNENICIISFTFSMHNIILIVSFAILIYMYMTIAILYEQRNIKMINFNPLIEPIKTVIAPL